MTYFLVTSCVRLHDYWNCTSELNPRVNTNAADGWQVDDNKPEQMLIQADNRRLMQQALESLSVEFREVIVLRELEELSYKQIAIIIDIPIGTVMSRLGRGRKQLAEILAPMKKDAL